MLLIKLREKGRSKKVRKYFNLDNLKNNIDELKKKFQEDIDKRNKMTNTIKKQMDELSKYFSEQLAVNYFK